MMKAREIEIIRQTGNLISGAEFGSIYATPLSSASTLMSFFFDRPPSLSATWTIGKSSIDASNTIAFVGRRLWRDLTPATDGTRVYISLTPANPRSATTEETSVLCRAVLDEEVRQ
jgi:hypothetical protein